MAANFDFVKKAFELCNESVLVLKDSFGPNGLDCLISTSSGSLLLTSDGFQIIKLLSSEKPVGKLIFNALDKFYKNSGDFSKKFIMLTNEMLFHVLNTLPVEESAQKERLLYIAQSMSIFLTDHFQKVWHRFQSLGVVTECTQKNCDIQQNALKIMKDSVVGKFSPKTCEFLVNVLQELLFNTTMSLDVGCLKQRTLNLLDSFSSSVWEVPGKPLESTIVLSGLVIPRGFLTMVDKLPRLPVKDSFKFVLLGSSLGYELPESHTILSIKNSKEVGKVLQWRTKFIEGFLQKLARAQVEMIIASGKLLESFVHLCNKYHIAAVHLVSSQDMAKISQAFNINVMYDACEKMNSSIGVASSCEPIKVGQHFYTHLKFACTSIKQVLLYAPTETACCQYSVALQNMLKTLHCSFKELSSKELAFSVVPGSGVFELVFAYAIEEYRESLMDDRGVKMVALIIERALLGIPRQLAKNSNCSLSVIDLKVETKRALTAGEDVLGISQQGVLGSCESEGIIEPALANYSLLSSVILLFIQILRTDSVIHVKTLPAKNCLKDDETSDEDC